MNILFSSPLYPSSRSSTCISFFCMYIIINFKTTRVKTWVQISKVMPQPKSIPPGKGGKPYGKRSKSLVYNMVRLNRTYYSLFKLQAKFSKNCLPQSNSSELRKFRAVRPHSPRIPQNSHILHYVSDTCPGREPCKIPANYANSAQFAHTVREPREIRTFC